MFDKILNVLSKKSFEEIIVKFDGNSHQVDVSSLTSTLINFSNISKIVHSTQDTADRPLNINIDAISKGSFSISMIMSTSFTDILMIGKDLIGSMSNLSDILIRIYQLKQWLSVNTIDKIIDNKNGNISLVNNKNGNIIIAKNVYNIYGKCPEIDKSISSTFSVLSEQPSIEGLEIYAKNSNKRFKAKSNEFPRMSINNNFNSERERKIIQQNVYLTVYKLILAHTSRKWEFLYNNQKISAYIDDDIFFVKLADHLIRFTQDDKIKVDLEITQLYDEQHKSWNDEAYKIIKYYETINSEKQVTDLLYRQANYSK
jgi:hypothetical protein